MIHLPWETIGTSCLLCKWSFRAFMKKEKLVLPRKLRNHLPSLSTYQWLSCSYIRHCPCHLFSAQWPWEVDMIITVLYMWKQTRRQSSFLKFTQSITSNPAVKISIWLQTKALSSKPGCPGNWWVPAYLASCLPNHLLRSINTEGSFLHR